MRIDDAGSLTSQVRGAGSVMIVTEENVAPLYLDRVRESYMKAGFRTAEFITAPGEGSKSGEVYLSLLNKMAAEKFTRTDCVAALGGGVIGDLAGFAAATYLRGIDVIQIPTTLLAMVDSSVGGKTAINLPEGKNLAGAFHQPVLVCTDPATLDTLSEDIFRDGMAEVIKYGVIADADLFHDLCDPQKTRENIGNVIERCVAIKRRFVEEDEFDRGVRQLLNFGHTIGHAIEKASGYKISHGSAVAKGMAAMAEIAARMGWCSRECADAVTDILNVYAFDLKNEIPKEILYGIIESDKKRKGGVIDIVVPEHIGSCRLQRISVEELGDIL